MSKDKIYEDLLHSAKIINKETILSTFIDSLTEGVIVVNKESKILLINKKICELTGYTKDEVFGKDINIFIPKNAKTTHFKHMDEYFANPRQRPMGKGFDLLAKRKDNTNFPVEISLSHIDTSNGKFAFAFITDISTRKEIETELKNRNFELDAFAHTVAHDLNSSLNGIVGFSDLVIENGEDFSEAEKVDFLKTIGETARKMSNIISELLIFATMKKEDVDLSIINMKEIINNALDRLKYQIQKKSALIVTAEDIPSCNCYGPWIEEIWYNYISNALKYGGENPVVEIGWFKEDQYITYFVKDYGSGISSEMTDIIFEENNTAKDKLTKGMGLGLSIVKRIILKLNGKVYVESEEGKGSKFCFSIKQ